MANLRLNTRFGIDGCGGYYGESIGSNLNLINEVASNPGSLAITFYFHNSAYTNNANSQRVNINVVYSWNYSFDEFNNAILNLRTEIVSVTADRYGYSPSIGTWQLSIGPNSGYLPYNINYNFAQTGVIGGYADLGWQQYRLNSGTDVTFNTIYAFNHMPSDWGWCNINIDRMSGGLNFRNPNPIIRVAPAFNLNCFAQNGNSGTIQANIDYKNGNGSNTYIYCLSGTPGFANCMSSGSGTGNVNKTIGGLAPNTRYYTRVTANNGYKSTTKDCEFVTLVPNQITDATATSPFDASVRFVVQYGNKEYKPTTVIRYKKCTEANWTNGPSSTTTPVDTVDITGLDDDTCYQAQAVTTTTAGSYYGNIVEFTTPKKGAFGFFNKIEPGNIGAPTYETQAEICYDWTIYEYPATITVYYRVKDGYDPKWIVGDVFTVNEGNIGDTGEQCLTLKELFPNQTIYETYIHTSTPHAEWDGDISEFTTPLLPKPENHNCENFDYLLDLLCQAVTALPDGIKTIFANPTTKELCDPYSDNPTLATLWSRLLRFDHAAACLMCNMVDMALKSGRPGQYLVGEAGWVDLIDKIVEEEANDILPSSDAVYKYIYEKLHSVWHMHGSVDYLVGKSSELPDSAIIGSTAIVADKSQIWKKTETGWQIDNDATSQIDDFSVYHINYASDTSFGKVEAESAYYHFGDHWSILDADTKALEEKLKQLEEAGLAYVPTVGGLKAEIVPFTYDIENADCDGREVYFVTEPLEVPAPGYHLIKFITGEQATLIQNQDILDGATAQQPDDPTRAGYTFDGWADQNNPTGSFNWGLPIKKDYTLVAKWEPIPYTVSFDINGGTGNIPNDITAFYDSTIELPDGTGFSREGARFGGWRRDGAPFSNESRIVGDTTLVAFWIMDEFDITLDPQNGSSPDVITIKYGEGIAEPTTPTNGDDVFLGWFTSAVAGTGAEAEFNVPLYGPETYYGRWVPGTYTVTFDSNGGSAVSPATVAYNNPVAQPTVPTKADKVFGYWVKDRVRYDFSTPVIENFTLEARWLSIYTVSFTDSFGDTLAPDQQIVEGSAFGPRIPTAPARTGYTFEGWYTEDGRKWNVDIDTVTSDMVLVAIYKAS